MSGLFNQSEKVNNILFVGILALSILIFCISNVVESFRVWITLLFLFLLFSGIIFGFVSKNPKKAFFLGFLIWAFIPLYTTVADIIGGFFSISLAIVIICWTFICGILNGSVGYLATASHPDKKWRIMYRVLSLVLFFILLYITSILYVFSTVDLF
jgi:hypothetical protein